MANQIHWAEDPRELDKFVERLDTDAAPRRNLDRFLLRLYHGRPIPAPVDGQRASSVLLDIQAVRSNGFSLVREVGEAAAALVVRMPAMKVLPVGQQFKRQRGAKLMSRYLNGVFYANRVKKLAPSLFNDAICTRLGALKVYVDRKTSEIKYERLNSLWLLWDEGEGENPQSLYYPAPVSRRFLAARFPKFAMDILAAPHWEPTSVPMVGFGRPNDDDRVRVIEAWSLPMGELPGRHVIKLDRKDVILLDEKWEFDRFPVVPFRWAEGRTADGTSSYGGKPLAEIIYDHHVANNKIVRIMFECAKGAVPKQLLHEKSEIENLTSKIMETVKWRGTIPPTIVVPSTIGGDWWKLRDFVRSDAFGLAGVNQQAAQGTTGGQLVSQPAQRERMDIVSTRLIHPTEGNEGSWREVGLVSLMLAGKEYRNKQARVRAPGTRLLEEISWQDIDLREDEYALEVQSTAALPLTVGGRLDFVNDLMQLKDDNGASLIKARDGLKMLQVPDTEAAMDRETAAQDLADHQVEEALWEGNYLPPEPIQDLVLLVKTASAELMRALQNPTWPDDNLELCRRLIAEAKMLQGGGGAGAQPVPGAGGPVAGAVPPAAPPPGPGPGQPEALVPGAAPMAA